VNTALSCIALSNCSYIEDALPQEPSSPPIAPELRSERICQSKHAGCEKVAPAASRNSWLAFLRIMKQPIENEQRKEDQKKNPSKGIDPEKKEPEIEADLNDQDPGERQKENQNQQKDDPLAA
jgi:hypothetical protein